MNLRRRAQLRRIARQYAIEEISSAEDPQSIDPHAASQNACDQMREDLGEVVGEIDWEEILKIMIKVLTLLLPLFLRDET